MSKRKLPIIVSILTFIGFLLLYMPMFLVVEQSFNASKHGQKWSGFTLDWYRGLFDNAMVQTTTVNTLVLAVVSTIIATLLGTLLAIGLHRTPWGKKMRNFFDMSINVPVVTPDILMAIALAVVFALFRSWTTLFDPGMLTMIIAHITLEISFVVLVVQSRLVNIGKEQIEAARDLYATTAGAWCRVILPQLSTAIIAGALLAFTLSLDDFILSFFTSGPDSQTLPLYIYGSLKRGISPQIHALSTIIFSLTLFAMLLGVFKGVRSERKAEKAKRF
ncbi:MULTISPECIES: ABC transporter permease [Fibrobacter]|uniref:Spermidine/putrescine transport system permease protein n=1 Tax=Fibrobacter intestinalis TaxID=28122 RepID=A0A1M6YCE9_9BACT|nr:MULTISPECIES: ABC transporter permease [Fibrobacter]MDD7298137.1 ABC transporter permease [Fibrobacter intestinalis]PBC67282.1 ABC-type spermidine/putrescine transport system permease subunit II [Fibrobacter sp. UWS1]PBC72739.1 ABC-type spermidine/putrescine transport system permease subunit II [Fibrobacter sp. NR9]SHL15971.1 spermidine/putrescine transport system permease protein [Fibrobacter intestinalis]SJZ83798.1 spermidine/putrescine transport system permease protein [Fibrobacter intes